MNLRKDHYHNPSGAAKCQHGGNASPLMLPGGMCVLVRNIGRAVVHGDTVCGSVSPNELRRARCGAARECRLLRVGVRRVPASFWRFCAGWDVPCPLLAPGSGSASTGRCGSNMAGAKGFYVLETVRWTALSPCHRVWHGRVISACDEGTPRRGIVLRLLSVPRTGEGGSLSCCPWKNCFFRACALLQCL